jgi:glutamine cyclotransferase
MILFSYLAFSSCKNEGNIHSIQNDDNNQLTTKSIINLKPHIIRKIPHESDKKYTQGLEIHDSILYESTGLQNQSVLKKINLKTGKIIQMVNVNDLFGEGITLINNEIIMLTYRRGIALRFNPETLEEKGICFTYDTEGWGLTNDEKQLIMSDGSDKLYFRDPFTYKITKTLSVIRNNKPLYYINELEYVNGKIYANVYGKEFIVAIAPENGHVVEEIDASMLSCAQLSFNNPEYVLNGIAYNHKSHTFYLTGKGCNTIYEVEFK